MDDFALQSYFANAGARAGARDVFSSQLSEILPRG